ncbi:PrsW family glutamic-type intramembrane protease [Staphylococcus caeli]|uniref:Membrane spanning protein n=1 Tax=Staphylococcus caeli TaxID=2201815 RepID=A0A1D4RUM1_9STAP|nr:PrsW family glutamic-type intramembrane protease [Staphylococcus caeli]SCT12340.1 membrane spanning protein [Staphylococcus caeli]SCT50952.1 membrane spanning protein [Staphylococcus caeli]
MNCSNCGEQVARSDKFCIHCGHSVKSDMSTKEGEIQNENICPNCNTSVKDEDKFCVKCGCFLKENEEIKSRLHKKDEKDNYNESSETIEKQTAQNINLKNEAKNLFNNTTKSIGKFAGSEESLDLNLKDMFSEVFKPHSKEESDEVFIAGTLNTTPSLDEVSEEWAKPWVFSRVFLAFAITFAALWVLGNVFENTNAIPGLIFIGALTVPLTGLFFFYESNAFKNISLFEVLKMFFIGGVFSLVSTMILYNFITFSDEYYLNGTMTVVDAVLVGLVEETGKAIIIVYFINKNKTNKILNGLLIGGAIGAGFAVFESAGYILNYSTNFDISLIDMIYTRAWTAIGGHLVWSAIIGAGIVIAKEENNFGFNNILDKRLLFFFFSSVILHGIWDTSISLAGSLTLKYLVLIVIVWIFVFILMKAGLKQVNILQAKSIIAKEHINK